MNPLKTLGPRGSVGVNHAFVTPSLEVLSMLVEHVEAAPGNKAKFSEANASIVLETPGLKFFYNQK